MEPLAKRPRMGVQSHLTNFLSDDDDDELNFDPEEISQRRDPGYQLQQERGLAVNRLKSTFEHIFEKYERDFSDIGDEIDLRTGEIVVNNGHLHSMRNEKDVGDDADEDEGMLLSELYGSDEDEDGADDDEGDEGNEEVEQLDEDAEEDRILQGRSATTHQAQEAQSASRKALSVSRNVPVPTPIRLATQNRLASLSHSRYTPLKPSPLSSGAWEVDESLLDPAWRAPPLVQASLPAMRTPARDDSLYQLPATNGAHSVWASGSSNMEWPSGGYVPRARGTLVSSSPTRRLMPAPPEVDDEDEILMGGPAKTTVRRSGFASSVAITEVKKPAPESSPLSQKKSVPNKQHKNRVASGRQRKPALLKTPRTPDSTRKEPSSKPHQTLIVAIPFRKPPTPDSLTLVDDTSPRSDRARGDSAIPVPEPAAPSSPARSPGIETDAPIQDAHQPLSVPLASPRQQTPPLLPETAAAAPERNSSNTEQETQQPPPVELFSRNEIDPSYEFSDEDDLPPRKPIEAMASVLSESVPAVELDMPRETEPTLKRKRGRPKGWKKQKQPQSEDPLPPAIEARSPSRPLRLPTEEQLHLPAKATIQDSKENQSFAEYEELPELEDMPDIQEFLNAEELPDVLDLPDAQDLAPLEDLLPPFDNPEAEAEARSQDAGPSKAVEEPDTTIASNKPLRNLALIAPIEADIPSPVRSDDSLGLALDAIIASQGLFDESDRNPDSSPAKPTEESPTRPDPAPRSSTRKRRRSVHFLEGQLRGDHNKTRIVSTPPLRKGSSQHEETNLPAVQELSSLPEEMVPEPPTEMSDVHDLTSAPDQPPQSPAGGMFSARRARRRKGASLSSSPAPVISPVMKKPAVRRPAFKRLAVKEPILKRRSLLSIALADSDDEDPLNAMSLLTAWTAGASWSPRGAASTPPGSNKRAGGDSTRKRIAREGFGGLSTPTKRTGILAAGSPSGSVIYTPGGHARRCGVDGFRCDRDFCFTCLDG
ncbi:hypothetical protein B0T11DRAFT_270799 [Plectosphaerella cucumerina]|uniref:Centromere protein Scm3 n=1 Tax=Plectosphaerella cucumerina TaxID=40658 RepID=A0A8K0XA29_9PEZI|nr:hypothetical protein B0T11DRAFT_270799 [Plectosphaerella cucumerina]